MTTNNRGLVSASKDELMAIWLFDDDLFRLFDFSKFVLWCKITGVKVNGRFRIDKRSNKFRNGRTLRWVS